MFQGVIRYLLNQSVEPSALMVSLEERIPFVMDLSRAHRGHWVSGRYRTSKDRCLGGDSR